jgi:tRNA pseudouridine(38-40) synthase
MMATAAKEDGTSNSSNSNSLKVALSFGYNGAEFEGLDRNSSNPLSSHRHNKASIESVLLNAFVTCAAPSNKAASASSLSVKVTNISRATPTYIGEHASRQTLSFEISCASVPLKLPTPASINEILPSSIRVFSCIEPTPKFSARRLCDARTFEYLLPTYVFAPPSEETGYRYAPRKDYSKEELDVMYPDPFDTDRSGEASLFTTIKRTANRKHTQRNLSPTSPYPPHLADVPPMPSSNFPQAADSTAYLSRSQPSSAGGFLTKMFETLRVGRKEKPANAPSTSTTRSKSQGRSRALSAPPPSLHSSSSTLTQSNEEPSYTTDYTTPRVFDPIRLPELTEEDKTALRRFRATSLQLSTFKGIIGIYRGTHNWHNYVDAASPDVYIRIRHMEVVEVPEIHFGMEWVRVKVQASSFPTGLVRRMIGMAVMVVRTNTPQSVVANSFGIANIEVPLAPASGLIFDEPIYDEYNRECLATQRPDASINFDKVKTQVEEFRKTQIHNRVYQAEEDALEFHEWLRGIDTFAFMYYHYLNTRGIILPQTCVSSLGNAAEAMVYDPRP